MENSLITELRLTLSSERTERNAADITVGTDLTTSVKLTEDNVTLGAVGSSQATSVSYNAILNFLLIQTSDPITVSFNNGGATVSFIINNLLVLTGPMSEVILTNSSTSVSPTIKVIAS